MDNRITFEQCTTKAQQQEQALDQEEHLGLTSSKARRVKTQTNNSSNKNNTSMIPSIHSYILDRIKPTQAQKVIVCWRGIYNESSKMLQENELTPVAFILRKEHKKGKNEKNVLQSKVKQEQRKHKKAHRTKTKLLGFPNTTLQVYFKDVNDVRSEESDEEDAKSKVKQ